MSIEIISVPLPSIARLLRAIGELQCNGFGAVSKEKVVELVKVGGEG